MMLFIDKTYKVADIQKTERAIYLLPDSIPDENTFYALSDQLYIKLYGMIGEDEGIYKEMRVGDIKVYLRASKSMREAGMNILNVGDYFSIIDYRFL